MSKIRVEEVKQMSVAERLDLIEAIWESLSEASESLPLTEAQRQELDRRIADIEHNPDAWESWEDVKAALLRGSARNDPSR